MGKNNRRGKYAFIFTFILLTLVLTACSGSISGNTVKVLKGGALCANNGPVSVKSGADFVIAEGQALIAVEDVTYDVAKSEVNGTFSIGKCPSDVQQPTATVQPAQTTALSISTTVGVSNTPTTLAVPSTGTLPTVKTSKDLNGWKISEFDLSTDPIVHTWLNKLRTVDPNKWKTFPNVPNKDVPEFRVVNNTQVPDGVEYGTYQSPYCMVQPCDFIVSAREYRFYSGPYDFMGMKSSEIKGEGSILLVYNVGGESYTFRRQVFDNGFTVRGVYFNGDTLEWATEGLVGHGAANMLNLATFRDPNTGNVLNSGNSSNSGANCGVPSGCGSIKVRVLVFAGDRALAMAETTIKKP